MNVRNDIKEYIKKKIFPIYEKNNIGGHGIDHIKSVINRSFELIEEFNLDVDEDMCYVIAAFHDIGYGIDADRHEEVSSEIFLEDKDIQKYFTKEQNKIIAEAIVDHRASLEYEARSIYGKIVSSADREISVDNMLDRSIKFQYNKHMSENPTIKDIIKYSYKKLFSKFGKDGYAKMYYPDQKYLDYLARIREILDDENKFIDAELLIINDSINQLGYDAGLDVCYSKILKK